MEILCLFLGRDELLVLLVVQWFWDEGIGASTTCGNIYFLQDERRQRATKRNENVQRHLELKPKIFENEAVFSFK